MGRVEYRVLESASFIALERSDLSMRASCGGFLANRTIHDHMVVDEGTGAPPQRTEEIPDCRLNAPAVAGVSVPN